MPKDNKMSFRVYRREKEQIVLCWNSDMLTQDQLKNVGIFVKEEGDWKQVIYHLGTTKKYPNIEVNRKIVIAVVDEPENGLNPKKSYDFILRLGKNEPVEGYRKVYPTDDLKAISDNKAKESFMRLWDSKDKVWRKAEGVFDKQGRFCLLTVDSKDI